jgi:hypothetical protein
MTVEVIGAITCTRFHGTHITFALAGDTGKTWIWDVDAKAGGTLGQVKWFGRWRKYSFFPAAGAIFEEVCMREISQFIVDRTTEHRKGKQP